jgi:hypothetical protein
MAPVVISGIVGGDRTLTTIHVAVNILRALSDFGRALEAAGVHKDTVEVTLPPAQWLRLCAALGITKDSSDGFEINGVRYFAKH